MDGEGPEGEGGSIRRACDQCRLRKIRCDKESPCANCRTARRACSSTGAGQKPKEPRQRVLISSQYERKIDQIDARLGGIEVLLRNLTPISDTRSERDISHLSTTSAATRSSEHETPSLDEKDATVPEDAIFDPEDAESPFEGNSALSAHTVFASQFLENAVQRTALRGTSSKIDAALDSLRHIVEIQNRRTPLNESRFQHRYVAAKTNLRDLPMPPMDLVVQRLRDMKHIPGPVMLATICCFTDMELFTDRCRRVYFSVEEPSDSLFIIVNVGLTYLFFEAALDATDIATKRKYDECCAITQRNTETAMGRLGLIMPATKENIEALLMAATFSVELSRPSLAWLLTTRAAHMCRALGFNNSASMKDDDPAVRADKALLFWCTYMLDKGLSLRLGRSAILQDYDISLPTVLEKTYGDPPGDQVLSMWIKHAEVQGKIYQRLYSPGALRQSDAVRREQVEALAVELRQLQSATEQLLAEILPQPDKRLFVILLKSDEVSYQSSLALVYRAIPGPGTRSRTFVDECLDTARQAMRCHQEAMELMFDRALKIVYIHWTIIYAPFIAFIVIFCHVIETSDAEDLELLSQFVSSLDIPSDISPGVEKLHRLCQVLYNVAVLYVEAKAQQSVDQDMGMVGTEFDTYLTQLGFMPSSAAAAETAGGAEGGAVDQLNPQGTNTAQLAQLGDWFTGNNYMLGLLEDDLGLFNSSAWSQQQQ